MIFDTGSANIWINSRKCQDYGCTHHKQYNDLFSKKFKKIGYDLDVEFGTGILKGIMAQDTFFLAGAKVNNQDFAEITQEIGSVFQTSQLWNLMNCRFLLILNIRRLIN